MGGNSVLSECVICGLQYSEACEICEGRHPCGNCAYFGEDCMNNYMECDYSDK